MRYFLLTALLLIPMTSLAVDVKYNNPTWGDIEQENPPKKVETTPTTSQIAYDGGMSVITAFYFCDAFGYDYVSHIIGTTANPSVIWKNDRWEVAGAKDDYLQIVCDDLTISSTTPIEITVNSSSVDYTQYFQFLIILSSSIFFGLVVMYTNNLIKKFT